MKFRNMFLKYMSPAGDEGAAEGSGMAEGQEQGQEQGKGEAGAAEGEHKPTDREAKLLKEAMSRKARIQELEGEIGTLQGKYKDVDVDLYKELLQERAERQQQQNKDEQERLKAEGKFDELLAAQERQRESAISQIKGHYETELSAKDASLAELQKQIGEKDALISALTIDNAFSGSQYIRDELVPAFTPSRTKKLYGEHFETEGGKIVPYDKPRGEKDRTVMVDKDGNPLAFEAAIAKLVEADPDADAMKRSKHKQGAASATDGLPASQKPAPIRPGVGRIEAALNKQG